VTTKGRDYFRSQGFDVALCDRLTPARPFTEVAPSELYDRVRGNVPRQAQAVFIAGNGLRAIGTIQPLEHDLGKPVITANQVCLWKASCTYPQTGPSLRAVEILSSKSLGESL
jgi:maleate isomerase